MMAATGVPVAITYRKAGTQPPIFVAGSFSDPPWQPQEMDYTTEEDGEYTFKKDIVAGQGSQIQYKFRVGEGEWWILDESTPTVTDEAGNSNNLLTVPLAHQPESAQNDLLKPNDLLEGNRRSHTPIEKVAETAAEVADTAATLDDDKEPKDVQEPSQSSAAEPEDASAKWDENEERAYDRVPLFTHEAGVDESVPPNQDEPHEHDAGTVEYDVETDPNDPNVEEMPTDLGGIMDTIKKVEDNRDEDVTDVGGAPLSPVVPPLKSSSSHDQFKEHNSQDVSHPEEEPPREQPDGSPGPEGSLTPFKSANGKTEASQTEAGIAKTQPPVSIPSPKSHESQGPDKALASDEDEGVVLKDQKEESTAENEGSPSLTPEQDKKASTSVKEDDMTSGADTSSSRNTAPEDADAEGPSDTEQHVLDKSDVKASENRAVSTGRDTSSTGQLTKRGSPSLADRPISPASLQKTDGQDGSWLKAFFRVIFVDWIGTLVDKLSRLCGDRRKTLLATGGAVAVLGFALWRVPSDQWERFASPLHVLSNNDFLRSRK